MDVDDRAFKLHDFVAHSAPATCLRIGRKSGKIIVTGGEDRKVNLWALGRTQPILSLGGHSSAVECVTMDWPEEIAVAGSSSGTIKLWDLEHAKVIRTLSGHKSNTRCVEFHPFGEFFASGSTDNTVKIWDVRRRGCIQTYTGHTDAINVMRITPDGRWIATGGADATVKIWDMTAGKLLRSYSDHTGSITSLGFHPAEFMMATGSSDRSVRMYDLQTFECISSAELSGSPPKVLDFDRDGQELLVATGDSLQIWTWEPAQCQDLITVRWPNVTDIGSLNDDGHLVGGALDGNFVSIWTVDLTRSPIRASPEQRRESSALDVNSIVEPVRTRTPFELHHDENAQSMNSITKGGSRSSLSGTPVAAQTIRPRPSVGSLSDLNRGSSQQSSPKPPTPTQHGSRPSSVSISRGGGGGRGYEPGDSEESPEYGYQTGEGPSPSLRRQRSRSQIASQDDIMAGRETPAASASKGVMSFVPAGNGEKLLNLDIAKFVQGPQRRTAPLLLSPITDAPPPTTDTDIMETLLFRHASVVSILRSRLTSIRMVRQVWDESSIRQAVETMADLKDSSVWVDMLRVVNLKPKLVTLDVCVVLLGGVGELLFEVYEDYIVTACQTIRILSKSFANVILSTLNSGNFVSPGVDLVREERVNRCHACYRSFGDLHATLEELKRAPGNVGVAVRDALRDLQVFGFE